MPIITFKVSAAEARAIRAKARDARAPSVSAYLRKQALGEAPARPKKRVIKKHPVSGLLYDATPGGAPVTSEQIQSALADFP